MALSAQQSCNPPAHNGAHNPRERPSVQQAALENRNEAPLSRDGGHSRPEQGRSESIIPEHGGRTGSDASTRAQDVSFAQDIPLRPDMQQELRGIGAWSDQPLHYASILDLDSV